VATLLDNTSQVLTEPPKVESAPGTRLLIDCRPIKLQVIEGVGTKGKVVVRGEFGRCNMATENNRVYPKQLWEREFRRLSKNLAEKKVLGECDHPCFTDSDFRVLTSSGWKPFSEIKEGDRVWSRKDGKAVLSTVTGIVNQPYEGLAYHVKGRGIDSTFTPGHRLLLKQRADRSDSPEIYVTIAEIAQNRGKYSHSAIPKNSEWFTEGPSVVSIPATTDAHPRAKNDQSKPLALDASLFAAFMGLYLAEGYCAAESGDGYGVFIAQKNDWSHQYIYEEVLSKFPKELSWAEHKSGFYLSDARLYNYLKRFGTCYDKYVPEEVKKLNPSALREFLFWYGIGDGRMVKVHDPSDHPDWEAGGPSFKAVAAALLREENLTGTRKDVFSVSKVLIEGLQECLIRSGGNGTISKLESPRDYEFADHTIKVENKVPLYQLHISQTDHIYLDPRFLKIEEVSHKGNIYCLSVTGGNFYVEHNGRTYWTGNSDGRTSLARVSHVITNLTIEDGVVVGEAEVLDTERGKTLKELLKSGCAIGVSSRGYGSTKQDESGKDVVQDDYRLVTFDFVAEPADSNAYPDVFFESKEKPVMAVKETATANEDVARKIEDARKEEREKLRDQYQTDLLNAVAKAKTELKDEVRGELLSDPSVAGAKTALEGICSLLKPYGLSEEASQIVKHKDEEISSLKKSLAESELKVQTLQDDLKVVSQKAREAGYRFFLERNLAGNPDGDLVRKLLGDVNTYKNLDELKSKMESICGTLSKKQEVSRKEESQKARVAELAEQKLTAAQKQYETRISKLEEALEKSLQINKDLGLRLYAEKKLVGNPKSEKLRPVLESVKVESKSDIDSLLERFDSVHSDPETLGSVRARVRRAVNGGRGITPRDEEGQSSPLTEDFNGLGIPLKDLQELSGIKK